MIIDADGLFNGERLAACSDKAQLMYPRLMLAANSLARIELSYNSIVSRVFRNFREVPKSSELWDIFREYEANFLAILYESPDGGWWCQFVTSAKFLPKYNKTRDKLSPEPTPEMYEKHHAGYLAWKRANSLNNQSFQKSPESFQWSGVGIGIGEGKTTEKPQRKGTRLDASFQVTEEHRKFAHQYNLVSPDAEIDRFRDYWIAQPGAKGVKLDWDATFRNWLRNSRNNSSQPSLAAPRVESLAERLRRKDAEARKIN